MLQRLYRIGSGCGIEIRGDALVATAVKSRPNGVSWLGSLRIEGFRERPASEWGAELNEFLTACGIAHVAVTFVLPREDVIVRVLQLPPMSAKERESAVRYQLDGLHPYADDEVYFTFAPVSVESKGPAPVAVAIAEKTVVDRYADLLEEAGLAVAAFTVSSSALFAALRIRGEEPPQPLLIAIRENDALEVYGESAGRPLLNVDFNLRSVPAERALQLAMSDLRLGGDEEVAFVAAGDPLGDEPSAALEPRTVAEVFPAPLDAPEELSLSRDLRGLATALESACPRLGWRANLLPEERRKGDSRLLWAPTAALAFLLIVLGVGFLVRPWVQNGRYAAALEQRAVELERIAATGDENRAETAEVLRKIEILERLEARTKRDLETLSEASLLVPDTAWLSQITVRDEEVQLVGLAASAAPLLGLLNEAGGMERARFSRSLTKDEEGERFLIAASRTEGATVAASAEASPSPADSTPAAAEPASGDSQTMTTLGEEAAAAEPAEPSAVEPAEPAPQPDEEDQP